MTGKLTTRSFAGLFNLLELAGILTTLFMAFAFQIILNELPCPLCLLQRIGFLGIAFGFLLNLRFGMRPSHYAIALFSAIYTSFVALRQIALHVVPGTGSYGDALLGFHLYTWSFIISMTVVTVTILLMGLDRQYEQATFPHRVSVLVHVLFSIMVVLTAANLVAVYMECGLSQCPDNPVHYRIVSR
ncbi:Disulfide bond formation protein B [Aquicella siphonis]|uniref:Disulfide bond formation protein B n=1 Tax=Aquicella siphonis TaxID=254247 RepID=A0A5E4PH02_9COXI|nr:disulfide bond formation protein B [Aquicella siphonis]VVC75636.1 Disulfide bond formation protein B [Aquicella siphonis]